VEGELAGAGAHEVAADADVVAEVEELVEREEVFADVVFADVDLEALAVLLEGGEAGFALDADGHDAAGDGGFEVRGFEVFGGEGVAVLVLTEGAEVGDGVGEGEGVGVFGFDVRDRGVGGADEGGDLGELVAGEAGRGFLRIGCRTGTRSGTRCGSFRGWMYEGSV